MLSAQPFLEGRHKHVKKRVVHIGFFTMTVIILIYIFYIGIKNILRYNAFKQELSNAFLQLEEEYRLNRLYKRQLADIDKPEFWEIQAKEQLGFVKKGEVVYKLYK